MNKSILHIELRKVLPVYITAMVLILSYILFWPRPLLPGNMIVTAAGFVQGYLITWIIFRDAPTVECFLFSRGITRQTLFWHRWTIIVSLMLLTLLVVAAIISTGLRCLIFANGPWHPMVKWYELNILWPLGLASIMGVSIRMFLLLRDRFLRPHKTLSTWRLILKFLFIAAALVCLFLVGGVAPHFLDPQLHMPVKFMFAACLYVAGLLIFATGSARSCFLKMEIHA